MDALTITDLAVQTRIGISDAERSTEQRILVSVALGFDASVAGKSDSLDDTIDYASLIERIKAVAKTERRTIERLAEDVAAVVLAYDRVTNAEVTITKFPPLGIASASVTIERSR